MINIFWLFTNFQMCFATFAPPFLYTSAAHIVWLCAAEKFANLSKICMTFFARYATISSNKCHAYFA